MSAPTENGAAASDEPSASPRLLRRAARLAGGGTWWFAVVVGRLTFRGLRRTARAAKDHPRAALVTVLAVVLTAGATLALAKRDRAADEDHPRHLASVA